MYEIIELNYSREELQTYINKKGHTFLGFSEGLMIFKVKKLSNKSTELMKNKTLLDLIKTLNIEDFKEFGNEDHLKEVMKDLYIYWRAKNDGGTKERWQMEKVFDIRTRYYTFLRRAKTDFKPKKQAGIRKI